MLVTGKRGSYRPNCGPLRFFKSLRGMPDYAEWILYSYLGLAAYLRARLRFRQNHSAYSGIRHSCAGHAGGEPCQTAANASLTMDQITFGVKPFPLTLPALLMARN